MTDEVRQICGLRLRASVALPQLRPATGQPDVVFRITAPRSVPNTLPPGRPVVDWRTDDETIHWALSEHAGGWFFRIPGFVDLAVNAAADEAVITPHDEEAVRFVPVLISGTLAAVVLTVRGHHPIHASGVEIGGRCLAFAGDSGSGKSTMTALFCNAGTPLVADDVLVLEPAGDTVTALPGSVEVRLRAKAADLADRHPSRDTIDDRVAIRPPAAAGPLPLAAIVEPSPNREVDTVEPEVLGAAEAIRFIDDNHRIWGWFEPAGRRDRFAEAAVVASAVPVVRLQVPWGPPFAPDLVDQIIEALRRSAGVELGHVGHVGQR